MSARYLQNADSAGLTYLPSDGIMQAESEKLYVVEWSPDQRCFHIQKLGEALAKNLRAFLEDRPTGYHPVGLFASRREASAACEFLRRIRDARERRALANESKSEDDEI